MSTTFPIFGFAILLGVMVVASYTFAVSLAAGANGRMRTLQAARFGAYGTVALIATAVLCLAYAFISHDFRIRYVAHYSDRSMPLAYLITSLWGGQDGSLLWWLFLLSLYIGACVKWLGKKYLELQPYVIATLMAVVLFFCVLMAFAANPFSVSVAGSKVDGEGLNPLLQNYWMIIHPPSLYTGFVGCTVPFAFAIAALVTGRLDVEWIVASRKWMIFSWMFLAIGNTLGMRWAYEELGWGGYWGWDPVENAAFMPLIVATAFVHSVMIQERRGLLKVWNVFLVALTFLMTIFGTFLTRSGAIASVHSFAQSDIGKYFVWFIAFASAVCATLIFYRWPELRDYPQSARLRKATVIAGWVGLIAGGPISGWVSMQVPNYGILVFALLEGTVAWVAIELVYRRMTQGLELKSAAPEMESVLSREFTFLLNNYALLGFMLFVLVATTFPMISEALWNEKVTVGPPYYNAWVQPIGLTIFAMMGIGTLFGWKKTSPHLLRKAFFWPTVVTLVTIALHFAIGRRFGFAALVWGDPIYPGALGKALRFYNAFTPMLGVALCAFNASVIVQEFAMLFRSRAKTGASESVPGILWYLGLVPGFVFTLFTLAPTSRRRYGGYVVHFGIVVMLLGFTGRSWTLDREASLSPGESMTVENYKLEYTGERMEVDLTKRMIFADLKVTDVTTGKFRGTLSPAKFIYKKQETATTEVAMLNSLRDDLYVVVGTVSPQTRIASFQVHVNPLVALIWIGCLILIGGSIVCMWPQLTAEESLPWAVARSTAAIATSVILGILLAMMPAPAYAQGSSTHAGVVVIRNEKERDIFGGVRCMCGGCERLPLTTCGCAAADDARAEIRAEMASGLEKEAILLKYQERWGSDAITVPPNTGAMRTIYAVPLVAIAAGGIGLAVLLRRWRKPTPAPEKDEPKSAVRDDYDARLDEELKDIE